MDYQKLNPRQRAMELWQTIQEYNLKISELVMNNVDSSNVARPIPKHVLNAINTLRNARNNLRRERNNLLSNTRG